MDNSIFAKIVAGEMPCHKIYEDAQTLAFLDVYPKTKGHVLVIPKVNPAEFVWDLDDETYAAVMNTARRVALRLRETIGKPFVHEAIVGTDVPYAHVHLIPFSATSELHTPQRTDIEPDHETLAQLATELRFNA